MSLDDLEDRLRGNSPRRHLAVAVHVSKQAADRDVRGGLPASNGQMCPVRYRHTPNPSTFADQVRDDPPPIPSVEYVQRPMQRVPSGAAPRPGEGRALHSRGCPSESSGWEASEGSLPVPP